VTETEILYLIEESLTVGPIEGRSVSEIVAATGMRETLVRNQIKQLMDTGKVSLAGREKRKAIDGSMRWVPIYKAV
jgi:hypothetical protein